MRLLMMVAVLVFQMAIVIVTVASWTTVAFVEETTLLVQVVQI